MPQRRKPVMSQSRESPAPETPHSVIIADDHPFMAEGLHTVLKTMPHIRVVGIAHNGIEAISLIKRTAPRCAVLDLSMPGANGLEVFMEARRWSPKTRFAIVTGRSAATLFKQLYDAGIHGLFVKNGTPEEICDGIARVCAGERVICGEAVIAIKATQNDEQLSKREMEVLHEIAKGHSSREIADVMGLSPKTIESHRTNLLRKMSVNSTASLMVEAMRRGMIDV